jgi:hypothetical protein
MAVVRCIIGNYKKKQCLIANNCKKMHKSKQISKSITHISNGYACGKRSSPSHPQPP